MLSQQFGCTYFTDDMIVYFGSGLDQFEFGIVAVSHFRVQLPLDEKGYHKPINSNQSVLVVFQV